MDFIPDVIAPKQPREQDLVVIVLMAGDAHKLAISDAQVGMLVRQAITTRLVNPPHPMTQHTRRALVGQEQSERWRRLYDAMRDDINPNA